MHATPQGTRADIDGRRAWLRLVVCMLLGTIGSVGMWSIVVVLPAVQAEFGVTRGDASLPYTLTMLGFASGNVLLGRIMDRTGVIPPLLAGIVCLAAGYALAAAVDSVIPFAILQGVIGFGAAATFSPLIADLSHWFRRRRGIAVAAAATGNYVAGAVWPLAMQLTLPAHGWRTTYLAIGAICLLLMTPLAAKLRARPPPIAGAAEAAAQASRLTAAGLTPRSLQILLSIAGLGCCVAMSMPQVHIVAYCVDLGFGVARGSEMLALMLAGGVVSRLASGFLADYIGGARVLLLGSVLQALSLGAYIPFNGLASLYIVSAVFGLSQGGIVPSYAIIVREYLPAHEAGRRVGIVMTMTIIGMALGGWLSGAIYDATGSYRAAFLNGIVWNALNILIVLFILGSVARRPGPQAVTKPSR
ncbi:MFS transporter [Elioraea tepidiphila]|jgi:MFS family permease|uniref:MFS transporter n=1 Tax=Elioraea tepidiphila TaxID=457934 RepID=UPI0003743E66|nr:MFS transporter [Elioraea tepidiphila]